MCTSLLQFVLHIRLWKFIHILAILQSIMNVLFSILLLICMHTHTHIYVLLIFNDLSSCDIVVVVVVMCYSFLVPPTSASESHTFPHANCVYSARDPATGWCVFLLTTWNAWNMIGCECNSSPHLLMTLWSMWLCTVMCCGFLLPPTQEVSPTLPHAQMMCAVSVVLAITTDMFSLSLPDHTSIGMWVMHPPVSITALECVVIILFSPCNAQW